MTKDKKFVVVFLLGKNIIVELFMLNHFDHVVFHFITLCLLFMIILGLTKLSGRIL